MVPRNHRNFFQSEFWTTHGVWMIMACLWVCVMSWLAPARALATPADASAGPNFYVVRPGDTLWDLSRKFGISLASLERLNPLPNPNFLRIGQVLIVGPTLPQPTHSRLKMAQNPVGQKWLGAHAATTASKPIVAAGVANSATAIRKVLYCTLTAYTAGYESTGKTLGDPGYDVTATGTQAVQGITVAVDPHVIPYGTKLYIPGVGVRVAEDTGGAIIGQHIDVFYDSLGTAINFGVKRNIPVYELANWFPASLRNVS